MVGPVVVHVIHSEEAYWGVSFKNIIRNYIHSEERPIYLDNVEDSGPHRRDRLTSSMWTGSKARDGGFFRCAMRSTLERNITKRGKSLKNIAGFTFLIEEPRAISSMSIVVHSDGYAVCIKSIAQHNTSVNRNLSTPISYIAELGMLLEALTNTAQTQRHRTRHFSIVYPPP